MVSGWLTSSQSYDAMGVGRQTQISDSSHTSQPSGTPATGDLISLSFLSLSSLALFPLSLFFPSPPLLFYRKYILREEECAHAPQCPSIWDKGPVSESRTRTWATSRKLLSSLSSFSFWGHKPHASNLPWTYKSLIDFSFIYILLLKKHLKSIE